ncbi:MAG: hypothetical protein JEY71_15290 [Sphaerochaeta sp.]|nr:hypothetical protein [Sphaerochaeta sp.]
MERSINNSNWVRIAGVSTIATLMMTMPPLSAMNLDLNLPISHIAYCSQIDNTYDYSYISLKPFGSADTNTDGFVAMPPVMTINLLITKVTQLEKQWVL